MTCMEEIFWTPRGVAHVARKAPVLPTCMRANHFIYIYIYIYIYKSDFICTPQRT